ncbi:MAG: MEDS domain-containing protein, partial [Thermoanaerobaculia bacterium]
GIDTERARFSGQLEVLPWEKAYLRGGHFDQDAMLVLIEQVLNGGKAQGYPITRLVANMEWALEDRPGVADVVEYETRLNFILPKFDDAVV